MVENKHKSGFIAIIGRTNVGKSTLMNRIVGEKVAIVSDKPQTTRNKILGIMSRPTFQIIFLDTPGIHKPKTKLGEAMVDLAERSLHEVDVILYIVDGASVIGKGDQYINERLKTINVPVIIAMNKIDQLAVEDIGEKQRIWDGMGLAKEVVPVSALEGTNVENLITVLIDLLSEGPKYYPDDMISDQPENIVAAEIIREKVLHETRDEVPHSTAVVIDAMEERDNGVLYMEALIYVERDSQKGIIIGKEGLMLKKIGQQAREELERIFGARVFLSIRVKVRKNWRKNEAYLKQLGYSFKKK